jgi:phospholipase C
MDLHRLSRRRFLSVVGLGVTASVLDACSSSSSAGTTTAGATSVASSTTVAPAPTAPATTVAATTAAPTTTAFTPALAVVQRAPGQRPYPDKPEGTDSLPQIEHVVVLMMENHSFDNYFGTLGRGDGFTIGTDGKPTNACLGRDGKPLAAFHMANTCQLPAVPAQDWNDTHIQFNGGKMDGFVTSASGPVAMGYWTDKDIPFYAALGRTFPLCDRWFGSCMGQTYPNKRYLFAATSGGNIRTEAATLTDPPPANGTILELLNRNKIAWKNYYSSLPSVALFLKTAGANPDKLVKIDQFFTDAAAGTLPAVSYVDPDFEKNSEENQGDISLGENFSARVINAVMSGPKWGSTLLVWFYDEHGGYYDHVPPPAAPAPDDIAPRLKPGDVAGGFDQLGMRVPAVVISPWARKNYVSSVVRDHTAVLSFLEHKWNLPALTKRDGGADNLMDCLDVSGAPAFATPPTLPAPLNPGQTPLCTTAGPVPNPNG